MEVGTKVKITTTIDLGKYVVRVGENATFVGSSTGCGGERNYFTLDAHDNYKLDLYPDEYTISDVGNTE